MNARTVRTLAVAGFLAAAAPTAMGQAPAAKAGSKSRVSAKQMRVFGGEQTLVPATGSVLVRSKEGAYMSVHAAGLTPGTAVTAWWVFFNSPEGCLTSPCTPADLNNPDAQPSLVSAAGRIVGPDGTADFGAYRAVGDTTGAFSGPGLLNPFKAEIHLVVRSHGPAVLDDPQVLQEQLSMFNGGCPPNTCANLQAAIHEP
jgi:hypothetical protein